MRSDPRLDDDDALAILRQLKDCDEPTLGHAARCCGAMVLYADQAVTHLEPLLENNNVRLRDLAASSILRLNSTHSAANQLLLADLDSKDPQIRYFAASLVGTLQNRSPSAIRAIRLRLHDEDLAVRVMAACSLWSCTGEDRDVLPVLIASLNEPEIGISMRTFTLPSSRAVPHYWYAIGCLGDMASCSRDARAELKRMVNRERTVRGDWNTITPSLITAWGKVHYGTRTQLEAYIAVADHATDPLREEALKLVVSMNIDEGRKRIALWRQTCNTVCNEISERPR